MHEHDAPAATPRIVVTGSSGQVGWELLRALSLVGDVIGLGREELDLGNPVALERKIAAIRPDVIVNAAAYTSVDGAENEPDVARQINTEAVGVLGAAARRCGALLVHYSTDYVFDGTKQEAYFESDVMNPISIYGRTKRDGEIALRSSGCDHLILRTSWVYAARGRNFLLTMLRLACERSELRVVDDQHGAPTWARTIADATMHMVHRSLLERRDSRFESVTVNLTAAGSTSWHGFAVEIVRLARLQHLLPPGQEPAVLRIPSSEYPTPARRPCNSVLDLGKLASRYDLHPPRWDAALRMCLEEIRS